MDEVLSAIADAVSTLIIAFADSEGRSLESSNTFKWCLTLNYRKKQIVC